MVAAGGREESKFLVENLESFRLMGPDSRQFLPLRHELHAFVIPWGSPQSCFRFALLFAMCCVGFVVVCVFVCLCIG